MKKDVVIIIGGLVLTLLARETAQVEADTSYQEVTLSAKSDLANYDFIIIIGDAS